MTRSWCILRCALSQALSNGDALASLFWRLILTRAHSLLDSLVSLLANGVGRSLLNLRLDLVGSRCRCVLGRLLSVSDTDGNTLLLLLRSLVFAGTNCLLDLVLTLLVNGVLGTVSDLGLGLVLAGSRSILRCLFSQSLANGDTLLLLLWSLILAGTDGLLDALFPLLAH